MTNQNKCPHCGHPAKVHSREGAVLSEPGTCCAYPPDSPCSCPGWLPKRTETGEVIPIKTGRIARPRGKGRPSSPGTGYVSPMEAEWPDEGDAA
jgi:hypothetical protein